MNEERDEDNPDGDQNKKATTNDDPDASIEVSESIASSAAAKELELKRNERFVTFKVH